MRNPRLMILAGVAALVAVVLVAKWVSNWGLVSVNVRDVPLAKVIKSIERQGGIKIATNGDPATPVTMLVERVPAYDAVDTLAASIDANANLAYVAAPTAAQIKGVLMAFAAGSDPGDWAVFSGGFGRGPGGGEAMIDPREIRWKPSEVEDRNLQTLLDQGAQKTGALFAAPKAWNPVVSRLPKEGRTISVTSSLVKSVGGKLQEFFLLTVDPPRPQNAEESEQRQFSRTVFTPRRGGGERNPQWAAERAEAQIAVLPVEQREAAKKEMDEMRALWQSIRALPEEERRAKIEEMMERPEVQERMEDRMNQRDEKSRPERREDRMRRYLDRKAQMKGTPAKS